MKLLILARVPPRDFLAERPDLPQSLRAATLNGADRRVAAVRYETPPKLLIACHCTRDGVEF